MKKTALALLSLMLFAACNVNPSIGTDTREANYAKEKRFKALLYWEPHAEEAHVQFDRMSLDFFTALNVGDGFELDTTTTLSGFTYDRLKEYTVIVALNAQPSDSAGRALFEKYMENGGGWVGFHASAYNDSRTGWPWYLDFLGGGVFKCNNWPPQPALAVVDDSSHPVTKNLPKEFVLPASEFYQWTPEPRSNPDVKVLMSLSPKNYPIGLKDIVYSGDWPVVWTNTKYRMIYLNMGHGDQCYKDGEQNLLFVNALRWIVSRDPSGNPFDR